MNESQVPLPARLLPSGRLRRFVSQYWVSWNNTDPDYPVFPDGSVDLVWEISGGRSRPFLYGTTTAKRILPLEPGGHYIGIRFRPGQSRHFWRGSAAELTDARVPAEGLLRFPIHEWTETFDPHQVARLLNESLERGLSQAEPSSSRIDQTVGALESVHGGLPITEVTRIAGTSLRHFEREFRETIGIPAKLFSEILRFRQAARLIVRTPLTLAQIAADLGYSDQSHLSHECKRFSGLTPSSLRGHGEFLQDPPE